VLKRIPGKNKVLENEINYLQEQHKNGYKLVGKNLFFYQFAKVAPEEVTYEIDLLPGDVPSEYLQMPDWELVAAQKMLYKRLKRVYYMSSGQNRMLVDRDMRLKYYQRLSIVWSTICLVFFFLFMVSLGIQHIAIANPIIDDILSLSAFSVFPMIIFFPVALRYEKAVKNLKVHLGQPTDDLPIHYTIRFSDLVPAQQEGLMEKLYLLGPVRQVDDRFFRLKSQMGKEELLAEIISVTNIKEENINLMHPMDLWFPMQ